VLAQLVAPQLFHANRLNQPGQPRNAIDLQEQPVQAKSPPPDKASCGPVWSLLGVAYKIMNGYEKARHSYDAAIHILNEIPNPDYALALDNLGTAEEMTGILHAANAVRTRSKCVVEAVSDHNSQLYFKAKLAYAELLRKTGSTKEAARLESDATAALTNVRSRPCNGCTISAESFQ
jgi:tetratricopeptide (TPR) repeat protein